MFSRIPIPADFQGEHGVLTSLEPWKAEMTQCGVFLLGENVGAATQVLYTCREHLGSAGSPGRSLRGLPHLLTASLTFWLLPLSYPQALPRRKQRLQENYSQLLPPHEEGRIPLTCPWPVSFLPLPLSGLLEWTPHLKG